ncbi:MAG: hypothetical protein ACM309_00335 [Bacillota bacterium]
MTSDARSIAASGEGRIASRTTEVSHGHGRDKTCERLFTELVGIESLCTYDQYCPHEEVNRIFRKDHIPHPINAVVVRKWDSKDFGPSGKTVFLTNDPVDDPFVTQSFGPLTRRWKRTHLSLLLPRNHPQRRLTHFAE